MIQTKIRKVGNSAGVILSKEIIRQANIQEAVNIEVAKDKIIITPVHKNPRAGWEKQLIKAGSLQDKELLAEEFPNEFDEKEWTW